MKLPEHIERIAFLLELFLQSKKTAKFYALSYTMNKYDNPEKYFHDLLKGLGMNSGAVLFYSFPELRKY